MKTRFTPQDITKLQAIFEEANELDKTMERLTKEALKITEENVEDPFSSDTADAFYSPEYRNIDKFCKVLKIRKPLKPRT